MNKNRSRPPLRAVIWGVGVVFAFVPTPALAQEDDEVRERVAALEADLDHPLPHRRAEAIDRLGRMGPDARRVLPRLIGFLERGDVSTRVHAARAASRIDPSNARVCSVLIEYLGDHGSHYALREASARALGRMAAAGGPLVDRIVPVLGAELRTGRQGNLVDVAIGEALADLGADAAEAAPAIEAALVRSPFGDVQITTFIALSRVAGGGDRVPLEELVAQLDDEDIAVRAHAFGRLRSRGRRAAEAVDALADIALSERPLHERVAALDCLGQIAPAEQRAIEAFVEAMADDNRWLSGAGGLGLAQIQQGAEPKTVDFLIAHLGTPDDEVRRRVLESLTRVAPDDPRTVRQLLALLGSAGPASDILYVYSILEGIRGAGPAARGAVGRLTGLLDRDDRIHTDRNPVETDEIIGHSLVALAELGIPDEAVERVLTEVREGSKFTLVPAIRAVGTLGPRGAPVVDRLIALLEAKRRPQMPLPFLHDAFPELEAIRALGRIGPAARAAIPTLRRIAERDAVLRGELQTLEVQAARRALEEIQG